MNPEAKKALIVIQSITTIGINAGCFTVATNPEIPLSQQATIVLGIITY